MFAVILTKGGGPVDLKEYETLEAAKKEYGRQVRNAKRRKSAWSHVQYYGPFVDTDLLGTLTWYDMGGYNCLQLRIASSDWLEAVKRSQ